MLKIENLQFFFQNRISRKLRVMATNVRVIIIFPVVPAVEVENSFAENNLRFLIVRRNAK